MNNTNQKNQQKVEEQVVEEQVVEEQVKKPKAPTIDNSAPVIQTSDQTVEYVIIDQKV